jgi:hypothetical protein
MKPTKIIGKLAKTAPSNSERSEKKPKGSPESALVGKQNPEGNGPTEAVIWVHRTLVKTLNKGRKETLKDDFKEERIPVRVFATTPAQIHVQAGKTIGLPNYSSDRIDIGVTYPCYAEEVLKIIPKVLKLVKRKINDEIEEVDLNELD